VVWFQNCSFLGEDRTSSSSAVTESLSELAEELKKFRWEGVRLLISSGKADKRRAFYKAVLNLGAVETFNALSAEDKDWAAMAETHVLKLLKASAKEMGDDAMAELVNRVGPNLRALANEVEKVVLYAGDRREITMADVHLMVTRQKHARAFALGEALGDRDLPKLLRTLDEELWEVRLDKSRSEIGLLYGLISKLRTLILVKELRREGLLKPARDYYGFKAQLERMSTSGLPEDRRFNPLALHPFVLFSASKQVDNYESHELVDGMETLLECNRRLVSSDLDEALVLQQAVVEIVGLSPKKARPASDR
jgi:DNA polymerase-3 subunit delta